jgi:endonuclease YncB( thermonuclease family)
MFQRRPFACVALAALWLFAWCPNATSQSPATGGATAVAPAPAKAPHYPPGVPTELYAIERVVDGDTVHIHYQDGIEKLRLLSVDTEEKVIGGKNESATKPGTVFGEECALWAQKFFADLAKPGETPRIGIFQPLGREQRDVYGRLLCHVILPDGTDFNVMLVQLGKSPYFNKYGNSTVCHDAFVAAQKAAREKKLGIWNPETNVPKTAGAPSARRPYEELIPWWQARADAIDDFRKRAAADPDHVVDAEWPDSLARGAKTCASGGAVSVFGSLDRLFDEKSGDWTALLRSEDKNRALRVRIPKDARAKFAALNLPHVNDEFRQNYFWVKGKLVDTGRGFELTCDDPAQWKIADPQPMLATPALAGAGAK